MAIHKPDDLRKNETHRDADSLKTSMLHITVSTRPMGKNGNFSGGKIREMNDRKYLEGLKTQARKIINENLKKHGFSPMDMLDPNREKTVHLGPIATRLERRGRGSEMGDLNILAKKKSKLNFKKELLEMEQEVLKTGKITLGGITYNAYPYPPKKTLNLRN